jgi:hypothetical protein
MLVVNPRNSPAATLGGAAYDYVTRSTPQSVRNDIVRAGDDAYKWLVKKDKALRAAPVTEALRLLKSGYIDPLADPLRVFQQAATERSRGNEGGGKKLAAMVPLSVAGVINPELRGAGKLATNTAVKVATKATPPLKVTPKAKPPSLLSAVRVGGKTYTGPTHLDALDAIPDPKVRSQASLDANSRGFVNERGKYMDRFKAADYARNFDLFSPDAPDWAKTAPEVISENLRLPELAVKPKMSTPSEQGAPRSAGWTPSRVKNLLSSYADFYEPDRTKALATRINPRDFLGLTLPQEFIETFDTQVTPLDMQRLGAETQPLFLRVSPLETGELRVTGHEGRHRMAALRDAGVDSVPIVVGFDKSATRGPLEAATLLPEQYIGWQPSGGPVGIRDALPISDSGLEALLKAMRGDEGFEFKIGGFAVKKPRKHKHQRPSPFASASNAA